MHPANNVDAHKRFNELKLIETVKAKNSVCALCTLHTDKFKTVNEQSSTNEMEQKRQKEAAAEKEDEKNCLLFVNRWTCFNAMPSQA